jgi:hypothetical protein
MTGSFYCLNQRDFAREEMKLAVISRGIAGERKKEMLTGGSHLSVGGREGEKIPLWAGASVTTQKIVIHLLLNKVPNFGPK